MARGVAIRVIGTRLFSQFMTLEPGDVIMTGTPAGVELARKPPRYLKSGDIIELGVDELGSQRQRVIA
jgi:2,4-diketo-3-deoxy-L-fuconate hydrolase